MRKMKRTRILLAVILLVAAAFAAGCGGVGSGDVQSAAPGAGSVTISGSVQTPAGGAAFRAAEKGAAQLANINSQVAVRIFAAGSSGRTLVASGTTDASGNFTITLPSGINLADYRIIVSAVIGAGEMRALATGNTGIVVSPVSEAGLQIIEERLEASGKNMDSLTNDEIDTISDKMTGAVASLDFSGAASVSDAVALAKSQASRDADVMAAVNTGISASSPVWYAVFAATDYSSGQLAAAQLNGNPALGVSVTTNIAAIDADPVITSDGTYAYVVNRGASTIQVFDPAHGFSLVNNYSTGDGSNPHDIQVISASKAYVTRYGKSSLLIVNPVTGAELGTIDLSYFADADGIPEMDQMVEVNGRVYVTVQKLVNYSPSSAGVVVVIDTASDSVVDMNPSLAGVQGISLNGYNPQTIEYLESAGKLYISCSGNYYDANAPAGVDTVSLADNSVTTAITSTVLGGSPGDVKMVSTTKGYVVVSNADWSNSIWAFNPSTGAKIGSAAVYTTYGYVPSMGIDPYGYLLINDTNYYGAGAVFVDVTTDSVVTTAPVSTGLPPFGVTFISVSGN